MNIAGLIFVSALAAQAAAPVRVYEGKIEIPTYQHSGRETQPPLFGNSTTGGMYPFTTYIPPFQADGPKPRTYQAIYLENEYLKLTYLPEFGGRFFSLYDKVRGREVFYRNDVIKPAHYNPRNSWPQSGIELTGPHDLHMMTLYGEPFWSHTTVRHADGSVSLVLGELDPVYHMKVNLSATLHPGIAALEMSVFCFNARDGRMPQMFWISASLPATEKTRFIYPMTRTIGHTTSEIADWPVYNGIDYSFDRNNKHMLGVFGIDIYDNFQGAYHDGLDYGVFRYADRRVVQGMKMWTFGYGPGSKNLERGYTDNAGPYVEVQSGRHVWDGHYEWVGPHKAENWSEWWVPVAGIGGLTTLTRDVAVNLEVAGGSVKVALSAARVATGAHVTVTAGGGEILNAAADLAPGKPFTRTVSGVKGSLKNMVVRVTDAGGRELMNYRRPDENPGRREYTPFTRPLESPQKPVEQMGAEELVLAAEFKLKELNAAAAMELVNRALEKDAGFSRAHLLLGIYHYNAGRYGRAAEHLEKAIARDPYLDEAYHYLAMSQFALGEDARAERNLYYIWPNSAYFGEREYHLGRLAFLRKDLDGAAAHLERAIAANAYDLEARQLLAVTWREKGDRERARGALAEIERIDASNRPARAERWFLDGDAAAHAELLRLTGGQSQEALDVSIFYRGLRRWDDAVRVLRLVEENNRDPWGTPPEFYYTLAWCLERKGDGAEAAQYRTKARGAAGTVDRFPYREESEAPLAEAVRIDPKDAVARFNLGSLLYYRERPAEAIAQWEAAVAANPADWGTRRALGLAYAEQGYPVEKSAAQLERAVELNPSHVRTLNDLSNLYAKAGRFDEQVTLLTRALERSPADDDLAEGVLAANLATGRYADAARLVAAHRFAPRHRTYGLRDKYRSMRYGMGGAAFRKGDYAEALRQFEAVLKPPVSLGVDDFRSDAEPRAEYYIGRALEGLGKQAAAREAYGRAAAGAAQLSGDRDSWNAENFHLVPALARLGRTEEAARLAKRFADFAAGEMDAKSAARRAQARYLLGLVRQLEGRHAEARKLMEDAVRIQPDLLAPRLLLRGDAVDPL